MSEEPLDADERRQRLRKYRGVVDHAAMHAGDHEHASQIVELSAAGVPVLLGQMSVAKRALLGEQLAEALALMSYGTLEDPSERERASVAARRAALRTHSLEAVWRRVAEEAGVAVPPGREVSVILVTNRPTYLEHAIAQVNHQSYQPRELVMVLHGDQFPDDVEEFLERLVDGPLKVVRVSPSATLGDALNAGTAAASGEVITKMDDDDWYGPDHLGDLVLAMEYSGAELVAKGAEFVYLEQLDLTMRRFVGGAESSNRTIAGGTLTITRRNLEALGGWRPIPHGVDVWLLADVLRAGGKVFRTHGLGYLYRRHSAQTWAKGADYFLRQSKGQWRGLDLDAAAVRWHASTRAGRSAAPAAPRNLSELRLAVMAGSAHIGHIAHVCEGVDARGSWRPMLESSPPHLVLIESSYLHERQVGFGASVGPPRAAPARVERAHELVAWCRDNGVPTALWETSPGPAIATPLGLMEEVRHLFCADPEAVPQLAEQLEGRRPLVLPLAAQVLPSRVASFDERTPDVAFLWPWSAGGEDRLTERAEEIFAVAERYGVAVLVDPASDAPSVPLRFNPFVTRVDGYRGALAALQRHRLVVPFDPSVEGDQMVPQVLVDAAAGGNVMLVPYQPGVTRLWRFLATTSRSWRDAERQIPRLLMDWEDWTEISGDSRRAVFNAHRYAHRVASVASVAGYSVLP